MHFEQRFGAREIKFLLSPQRAEQVRAWARQRLSADPNAAAGDTYRVTSLYFDTANFDVFHRRGSYGRAKYRVRRYDESDIAFVERKMRTDSLVSKRRAWINLEDVPQLSAADARWFQRRIAARQLTPVCSISYLRTALVGCDSDGSLIRLTLDEELCAARVAGLSLAEPRGGTRIASGQWILELKYSGPLPAMFKELLETFPLNRTAVSKYRTAAAELGLAAQYA